LQLAIDDAMDINLLKDITIAVMLISNVVVIYQLKKIQKNLAK